MSEHTEIIRRQTTRIEYAGFLDENLSLVRGLFEPWLWLVPPWCVELYIKYDGELVDATCDISIDYDYRHATLRIGGEFFEAKDDDACRSVWVIHELIHLSINQPFNFARDQFEHLMDDAPKFAKTVQGQLTGLTEQATQDLAYLIYRQMNP